MKAFLLWSNDKWFFLNKVIEGQKSFRLTPEFLLLPTDPQEIEKSVRERELWWHAQGDFYVEPPEDKQTGDKDRQIVPSPHLIVPVGTDRLGQFAKIHSLELTFGNWYIGDRQFFFALNYF